MKFGIKVYDKYVANIGLTDNIDEMKEFDYFSEAADYISKNFEQDGKRNSANSIIRIIER